MASKDAITLLKDDHREAEKLFKEFEKAKGDGRKQHGDDCGNQVKASHKTLPKRVIAGFSSGLRCPATSVRSKGLRGDEQAPYH